MRDKGDKGMTGEDGSFGGATFDYTFNTTTTRQSMPPSEEIRLNNSLQRNGSEIYLSWSDDEGTPINQFVNTVAAVTSSIKGFIRISLKSDANTFLLFSIKGFSQLATFYYTFEVENQSFSDDNPFNEEDDVLVSFVLNGQKGDKGDKGMTGGLGPRGITGPQGPPIDGGGVLPYEPYNKNINLDEFSISNNTIFYTQWTAPTSGNYTNIRFFTTQSSANSYSGRVGLAIYSNNEGNPGSPGTLLGSAREDFTNANMDRRLIDMLLITPVTLSANSLYWMAVAMESTGSGGALFSGFHNDYNVALMN